MGLVRAGFDVRVVLAGAFGDLGDMAVGDLADFSGLVMVESGKSWNKFEKLLTKFEKYAFDKDVYVAV